jgi:hypothetical protein
VLVNDGVRRRRLDKPKLIPLFSTVVGMPISKRNRPKARLWGLFSEGPAAPAPSIRSGSRVDGFDSRSRLHFLSRASMRLAHDPADKLHFLCGPGRSMLALQACTERMRIERTRPPGCDDSSDASEWVQFAPIRI